MKYSLLGYLANGSSVQIENVQATAAIAKELLESGSSPTAKALSKKTETTTPSQVIKFNYR